VPPQEVPGAIAAVDLPRPMLGELSYVEIQARDAQ
jgi:hypothetical protein